MIRPLLTGLLAGLVLGAVACRQSCPLIPQRALYDAAEQEIRDAEISRWLLANPQSSNSPNP